MDYIQLICTVAIILALIACDEILFTEGRQLKAMTKEEYESKQEKRETARQSPEAHIHAHVLPAPHANYGPIVDHSVTGKKDTPQTTKILAQSLVAGYEDDFRPTTPGKSPGVGHSFPEQMDDAQTKTKNNGNGVSQTMAGIRPAMRGHSPGVGHSFQSTNAEKNP